MEMSVAAVMEPGVTAVFEPPCALTTALHGSLRTWPECELGTVAGTASVEKLRQFKGSKHMISSVIALLRGP